MSFNDGVLPLGYSEISDESISKITVFSSLDLFKDNSQTQWTDSVEKFLAVAREFAWIISQSVDNSCKRNSSEKSI